jgi:hypothetical protein
LAFPAGVIIQAILYSQEIAPVMLSIFSTYPAFKIWNRLNGPVLIFCIIQPIKKLNIM